MKNQWERFYEIIRTLKGSKIRNRVVMTLSGFIVFGTVYMLILPAITLEKEVADDMAGISLDSISDAEIYMEDEVDDSSEVYMEDDGWAAEEGMIMDDFSEYGSVENGMADDPYAALAEDEGWAAEEGVSLDELSASDLFEDDMADGFDDFDTYESVNDSAFKEKTEHGLVTATADFDVFPSDLSIQVEEVDEDNILEAVTAAVEEEYLQENSRIIPEITHIYAADIHFLDEDNEDVQLPDAVHLTLTAKRPMKNDETVMVIRVDENGRTEVIEDVWTELYESCGEDDFAESDTADGTRLNVMFDAEEASVYAAVYLVETWQTSYVEDFDEEREENSTAAQNNVTDATEATENIAETETVNTPDEEDLSDVPVLDEYMNVTVTGDAAELMTEEAEGNDQETLVEVFAEPATEEITEATTEKQTEVATEELTETTTEEQTEASTEEHTETTTEEQTEAATEELTETTTEKQTEAATEELTETTTEEQTEAATEELTEEMTEEETEAATEELTEETTEEQTEAATEEHTETTTEEQTEAATEELTETTTEKQTEAASEELTEATTEKQTEAATEEITEATTGEQTEAATEEITEATTEEQTEAATEEITEATTEEQTEAATEELTEEMTEEETEAATEELTEEMTEEETEAATEELTEEMTEEETEAATEELTEATTEEETEAATEELTEAMSEEETEEEKYPARQFIGTSAGGIMVRVAAAEGAFPEGTHMVLEDVEEEQVLPAIEDAAGQTQVVKVRAVNITFYDKEENEIEPRIPVNVVMKAERSAENEDVLVMHVDDDGVAQTVDDARIVEAGSRVTATVTEGAADSTEAETEAFDAAPISEEEVSAQAGIPDEESSPEDELQAAETVAGDAAEVPADESEEIEFDAEGFSVYAIVYTVDFHWEVDGKMYQFNLPGGGYVSFTDLIEVLGVTGDTDNEENEAETETAETDIAETQDANGMLDITAGDAAKMFVAEVASVEFSSPELVWVGKVDGEATVGALKEANGLECVYSAELTKEQIAEINGTEVKAGDWALISVLPFTSEESLTVTMKNGEFFTIRVTDAQISAHVITARGERFRITVTFDEDANIPEGSVLAAEEIPEGSEQYEMYLEETSEKWEEADREGYISLARFFDIEILKDGTKIEPEAPVEVEIVHEDGLALFEDENLSVVHFAENGTEIIDEIRRNEDSTQIVYELDSFSVIGTVSTVKESGWPTSNGQYVLVLQDGDDYYALKQDGTLKKVRYFNNTVSFIGEGTTTTDYIDEYLWYVVSSGNRGKISDEYAEYNATPAGQTFIDPNNAGMFSGTSRQLQIKNGRIFCNGQLPGSSSYTQVTLSASGGQLSRVALTSDSASPVLFATATSFTANDNETDLFTQIEVESIIAKWKEQKTQEAVYDKTAEVYDYENRVYQIDITASSSDYEVAPSIALEFVVDASRSMFFPTSVTQVGTFSGTNASNVRDWINAHGNKDQVYFVIQDKNGKATQYAIFCDTNGQWRWVDASNYNPPDDKANGGTANSRGEGKLLSSWTAGSMDDGKIYTTDITGTSNGTYGTRKTWISRIEYLKQCVRVASQVIYAVDENAQIGLIGFNAAITDYGTFGKNQQQTLLDKIDNISLAGGTNHQGGLQKAIDKYRDRNFYAQHYAGRKHVVVLVTDGAPNASGVNWTTIGNVADTLKNLKDDFGSKTELYTMGLSLTNVGTNQSNLFGISSGAGYTYAGEDAAQIINAVTKMVDGIFVQANLVADVTDVIDPAFYPVDKANGRPLAENDWISLNGTKVNAGAGDAAGQIKKDSSTGNWYVEWKNQNIDWPTTDPNGAVVEAGWHGTVFVKAKEDFLGGNGISTNAEGSRLEAKKFTVHGETTQHDLPAGDHTTTFETPYVNVDELDITNNSTVWTVYLGTNVDPLTELKALWERVKVKEVVTKTDPDHRVSSDGSLTYQYAANTGDNRPEVNGREEFSIEDLGITLTDADWAKLITEGSKIFEYNAYDHSRVGTVMISLTQTVADGEKNLAETPHDTTVTGAAVEKYTLTVSYRPAGANISDWHTGSYGSGMSGSRAGNILKDNVHIINVFAKGLQITKVDLNDRILRGAEFALYRTAGEGETDVMEIDGGQYYKAAELDTSATGIAVKEQIEQLEEGEQYYLVETRIPDGYNGISPIAVNLSISDTFTSKPGTETQTTKPETGTYDWEQKAVLTLSDEIGVKRTDADNTEDLTHSGSAFANSDNEIIYYRITNNPGVALPNTGGPGTTALYFLGIMLTGLAAAGLVMSRKRKAA